MSSYRDDRQALRDQLDELTRELADLRAKGVEGGREEELAGLRAKVEELGGQLDQDRRALAELAGELAAFEPRADKPPTPSAPPSGMPLAPVMWAGGLALLALVLALPRTSGQPAAEATIAVDAARLPGGPGAVDLKALLPLAREQLKPHEGAEFAGFRARYVRSDGTLDLQARGYSPEATFTFVQQRAAPPRDPSLPVGVGQGLSPMATAYEVEVTKVGLKRPSFGQLSPFPLQGPTPEPRCSPRQLWDAARRAGAPEEAVATIAYETTIGRGPSWHFEIQDTPFAFDVSDANCERGIVQGAGRKR
jgi:hypothetical protein